MDAQLFMEASNGRIERVRQLLADGADIDSKNFEGRSPLHTACMHGYEAIVRLLLEKGAKTDSTDRDGRTPLHLAVLHDKESIVRILVDRGADVNAKDVNGRTPIFDASYIGNEDIARFLLDRGANPNDKDMYGKTPLHIASEDDGGQSVIRLLVARGADINASDKTGQTPLHWASYSDNLPVVRLLVDLGANINAEDDGGQSPADIAKPRVQNYLDRRARATARESGKYLLTRLPDVVRSLKAEEQGKPPGEVTVSPSIPQGLPPDVVRNIGQMYARPTPGAIRAMQAQGPVGAGAGPPRGGRRTRKHQLRKSKKTIRSRRVK